tara:strand:+ start:727 stop:1221 length:495 start_codon:yes stop_codon:yes gene_type:complete
MKIIGLLSDTHSYLHPKIWNHFKDCDEIWHAGDIGNIEIFNKLQKFKPLRAVYGNIDCQKIRQICPKTQIFKCEKINVWITHIGGYPNNYNKEIKKDFLKNPPNLFICGHSHILKVMYDKKFNFLHMNPGAAGKYGAHKFITMLKFNINEKKIEDLKVIQFPKN